MPITYAIAQWFQGNDQLLLRYSSGAGHVSFNPAAVSVDSTTTSMVSTLTVKTTGKNGGLFAPQLRSAHA
jgi:hypothetical protein